MLLTVLTLVGGLVVLTIGAEVLVRSASALAIAVRISPLVIGLTVVAFGTSTPELVVSVQSSLRGQAEIALGNVVGSNIFNVLFILGVSALIIPLRVSQQLVRFDVPLMIVLSGVVEVMAWDGRIGMLDGIFLSAGLLAYTTWIIVKSRKEQEAIKQEYSAEFGKVSPQKSTGKLFLNVVLVGVGLVLLVFGSRWFTDAAIIVARQMEISEFVIGLTIVAAGTSLPEVATSVMAAFRGERDIAVGNVVGSNLFNIMGVLGLSGIVSAEGVVVSNAAFQFDIPVMIAVAFACLPIFFTGHLIARWEGGLFFCYFCAYTTYLILAETNASVTRSFGTIMLAFVVPITVITLAVTGVRAFFSPVAFGEQKDDSK
jgi:cation:H+ antiporter